MKGMVGRFRGGDSACERGGNVRRKFWIKPLIRRPIWAWPNLFWLLKGIILNFEYMNRVNEMNWKYIIFKYFFECNPKRPLRLNIMVVCPENPKQDQNLKFSPLSETTSIPSPFHIRSPPPPPRGRLSGPRFLREFSARLYKVMFFFSPFLHRLPPWLNHAHSSMVWKTSSPYIS